jgi:hypothetical protein
MVVLPAFPMAAFGQQLFKYGARIGTYGSRARLNDAFWERQAANEYAVAEAQARLDRAQRALIQMR